MEIKTRKKLDELKNILEDPNTYAAMVFGSYVKNSDYNDIGSTRNLVEDNAEDCGSFQCSSVW
ncbi:hypothetical protein C9439_04365 [archaeon SCG-AAA382B04]|nr:hypothetical protein C9439_04365 [archaeon SCG-AAA382B04]